MKTTYELEVRATPACGLTRAQEEQVQRLTAKARISVTKFGRNNRKKLMRLAWQALRKLAPTFANVPDPIGGYTCGEPKEVRP